MTDEIKQLFEGEKTAETKQPTPKIKRFKALKTGSHQIGDVLYEFEKGDIIKVPEGHFESMQELSIMQIVE